jgi:arylformamidase
MNIEATTAMPLRFRECVDSLIRLVKNPLGRTSFMNQKDVPHFDLTLSLRPGMLRFPGDPDLVFKTDQVAFNDQMKITMSEIQMGVHLGTHVDAPGHFIEGATTVDRIPVQIFVGEMHLIDLSNVDRVILRKDLERHSISRGSKIFIKTKNSVNLASTEYEMNHVYLDSSASDYLIEKEIQVLGFDYYNIDSSAVPSLESHLAFAKADIPVIVAIDMKNLTEGNYQFSAVPLALNNLEASPVRVVVWKR